MPQQSRLVVKDLACEKGERLLFSALSFTVEGGTGVVITGPNGAGKTSLLRIVAGLATARHGSISYHGNDTLDDTETPLRERIHFLSSRDGLKAALTPREHCDHWLQFYQANQSPQHRDNAVTKVLTRLFLVPQADIPAGVLSSGQRRRLAFGRLLLAPRPIWLLDEPMNAVDTTMRETFMEPAMADHVQNGGILLVATHIPLRINGLGNLDFVSDGNITQRAPQTKSAQA